VPIPPWSGWPWALLDAGVVSTVAFAVIAAVGAILSGSPAAGRLDDRHDRTGVVARQPFDQGRPADRAGSGSGWRSFDTTKVECWLARTLRLAGPLNHLDTTRALTVPPGWSAVALGRRL